MTDDELREHFARVAGMMERGFDRLDEGQARLDQTLERLAQANAEGQARMERTQERLAKGTGEWQPRIERMQRRTEANLAALTSVLVNRLEPAVERVVLAAEALVRRIDALIQGRGNGEVGPQATT